MSEAGSSPTSTVVSPSAAERADVLGDVARGSAPASALPSIRVAAIARSNLYGPRMPAGIVVIALVFSYEVSDAAEFERVYGPDGEWAEFFRGGRGYVGTELLRDVEHPGRYLVIDRWESARPTTRSSPSNRDEYMRRVDETAFLYQQELRLGTFESVSE